LRFNVAHLIRERMASMTEWSACYRDICRPAPDE